MYVLRLFAVLCLKLHFVCEGLKACGKYGAEAEFALNMRTILRIATLAHLFVCLERNPRSTKINRAGDCTIRIISRRSVSYASVFRHGSILVLYVSLNQYSPSGVKFQQRFFDEDFILLFYEPNTLTRTLLNLKCNNSCTINFAV